MFAAAIKVRNDACCEGMIYFPILSFVIDEKLRLLSINTRRTIAPVLIVARGLIAALGLPMRSLLSWIRPHLDESILNGKKRTEYLVMAVWTTFEGSVRCISPEEGGLVTTLWRLLRILWCPPT